MAKSRSIRWQDARTLFGALAEFDRAASIDEAFSALGAGAITLTNARSVSLIRIRKWSDPEGMSVSDFVPAGYIPPEVQRLWVDGILKTDPRRDEYVPAIRATRRSIGAGRRYDLHSRECWSASELSHLARICRVGDETVGWVRLQDNSLVVISCHRDASDQPFNKRHASCIELLTCELDRRASGQHVGPTFPLVGNSLAVLTPRQRQLLSCLLRGQSVKEAARTIGVTSATASSYLKLLHARLGVHSRGELLSLVLTRATIPSGRGFVQPSLD